MYSSTVVALDPVYSSQKNSLLEVGVRWESGGTCTTHRHV